MPIAGISLFIRSSRRRDEITLVHWRNCLWTNDEGITMNIDLTTILVSAGAIIAGIVSPYRSDRGRLRTQKQRHDQSE